MLVDILLASYQKGLLIPECFAAAKILKAHETEIPGTVVLLFQPAEEGGAGGKFMVEEGALEGVIGIHGVHVMPIYPSGVITSIASLQHYALSIANFHRHQENSF